MFYSRDEVFGSTVDLAGDLWIWCFLPNEDVLRNSLVFSWQAQICYKRKAMQIQYVVWRLISSPSWWVIYLTWTIISSNGQLSSWNHNYTLKGGLNQKTRWLSLCMFYFLLSFCCLLFSFWSWKILGILFPVLNQRCHQGGGSKYMFFLSWMVLHLAWSWVLMVMQMKLGWAHGKSSFIVWTHGRLTFSWKLCFFWDVFLSQQNLQPLWFC
jgi:hypothetical protein